MNNLQIRHQRSRPIYSVTERRRRDDSGWTLIQGLLAPLQFLVFLVSLWLILRYLATGQGYALATASVVIKTLTLYAIMITGACWEKAVFGRYLFAPSFFWEDLVSMLVIALHSAYLLTLIGDALSFQGQMWLALAAYAAYLLNAGQFLIKFRQARRQRTQPLQTVALGANE